MKRVSKFLKKETTGGTHSAKFNSPIVVSEHSNAISTGQVNPLTEAKIVNEKGEEVANGQTGEIWVRGYGVAAGYWNNPEKTAEAFDKEGYLHTGDVGFRDDQGNYFIVDRIKDLIIASGYKIWPTEVEDNIQLRRCSRSCSCRV